jgi:proline racemase
LATDVEFYDTLIAVVVLVNTIVAFADELEEVVDVDAFKVGKLIIEIVYFGEYFL